MANWMQHFISWEEMLARNDTSLLVLENDALLVDRFGEKLARAMVEVPPNYDLLYVGSCLGRHAPDYSSSTKSVSEHIYRADEHRCASGYVLSRAGAEKLMRAPPMLGMDNIDEWMQYQMSNELTEVFWLEPVLCYEGTKSFLLPVFCSPRTAFFGCDPFWRPAGMAAFAVSIILLAVGAMRLARIGRAATLAEEMRIVKQRAAALAHAAAPTPARS